MEQPLRYLVLVFIAGPIAIIWLAVIIVATVRSFRIPRCPKCGRPKVRRSRRDDFSDFVFGCMGMLPYRCGGCLERFHAFPRRGWFAALGIGGRRPRYDGDVAANFTQTSRPSRTA